MTFIEHPCQSIFLNSIPRPSRAQLIFNLLRQSLFSLSLEFCLLLILLLPPVSHALPTMIAFRVQWKVNVTCSCELNYFREFTTQLSLDHAILFPLGLLSKIWGVLLSKALYVRKKDWMWQCFTTILTLIYCPQTPRQYIASPIRISGCILYVLVRFRYSTQLYSETVNLGPANFGPKKDWNREVSRLDENLLKITCDTLIPDQQNPDFLVQLTVSRRSGVGIFPPCQLHYCLLL